MHPLTKATNHHDESATEREARIRAERARDALQALPPDLPRDDWMTAMMAARGEGIAEEIVRAWSAQGEKYNARAFDKAWASIKPDGGRRIGTLIDLAKKYGYALPPRVSHSNGTKPSTRMAVPVDPLTLWAKGKPAEHHPYVTKKHLAAHELRVDERDGDCLLMPLRSLDGSLVSIQRIKGDGSKFNLKGVSLAHACHFAIGALAADTDSTIYLAEGIGTAAAVSRAAPHAMAVCTVGVSRFVTVGRALRTRYPRASLVIVSDRGAEDGARRAAKELAAAWVPMPEDRPAGFDAFDYECEHADAAKDLEAGSAALATWLRAHEDAEYVPAKLWTPPAITLDRLIANPPPKPRYVIEGRLTVGLHVVGGRPKQGKSLLAEDWAISVADGTDSWGAAVDPGHVWILDLENGARRAYERLTSMGVTANAARRITITTEWQRGNRDAFRRMLDTMPGLKLVVIDIWKKFCAPLDRRQDQYEQETAELQWLAAEANARGLAIVCVVHTVKSEVSGDVYSTIGGSNAVAGNPDGLFVLRKDLDGDRRTLHILGRDLPEQRLALRIGADLRFKLLCADADAMASDDQLRYLRAICDGHHMPSDLKQHLDVSSNAVWKMLARLQEMGLIAKPGGLPALTPIGRQMLDAIDG